MHVSNSAIENLLRVARSECASALAFASIADGDELEMFTVPPAGSAGGLSCEALAELVRQASIDPEVRYASVFVRRVQMGEPLTLAVAPVPACGDRSLVGVVGEADRQFEPQHLELLEWLAQRLSRHVGAMKELEIAPDAGPPSATSAAEDTAPAPVHQAVSLFGPRLQPVPVDDDRASQDAARTSGAETSARDSAEPDAGRAGEAGIDSPHTWWAASDPLTGLASLAQFFSRAGRLLSSEARASGALALVLVEIPDERTAPAAARALATQLRCSDPLARVDRDLFAAAVLLFPAGMRAGALEERLGAVVRSALDWLSPVRTSHVVAEPGDRRDIDELLRQALAELPGRTAGGGGAPWRGAGGSAARLPIP